MGYAYRIVDMADTETPDILVMTGTYECGRCLEQVPLESTVERAILVSTDCDAVAFRKSEWDALVRVAHDEHSEKCRS